jgi:hypothetical protein
MERVISFTEVSIIVIIIIIIIIFWVWGLSWNRNKYARSEILKNNALPTVIIYDYILLLWLPFKTLVYDVSP